MSPVAITIIVFLLVIIFFIWGKYPYWVPLIGALVIFQLTGILTPAQAWSGYSDNSLIMAVAMFIVAAGFTKCSLVTRMKRMLNNYQGSSRTVLYVVMLMAILLSTVLASAMTMVTMVPVIVALTKENDKVSRTRMIKASGDLANIWSGILPLGLAATSYMMWNTMIENLGGTPNFTIMDLTIAKIFPVLACTVWQFLFGYKLSNAEPHSPLVDMGSKIELEDGQLTTLTPFQDRCAIILFFGSVAGMIFVNFVPIATTTQIAVICSLLMIVTGVLTSKQAFDGVAWDIVLLYGGILPLSTALTNSGASEVIGRTIQAMLGGVTNPYILVAAFFIVPLILTQFLSNTAVGMIFPTLAATTCLYMGIDPRAAVLAAGISATVSVLTPFSSPSQSIMWGSGGYTMKDYLRAGLPLVVIFTVVFVFTTPIFFPFY